MKKLIIQLILLSIFISFSLGDEILSFNQQFNQTKIVQPISFNQDWSNIQDFAIYGWIDLNQTFWNYATLFRMTSNSNLTSENTVGDRVLSLKIIKTFTGKQLNFSTYDIPTFTPINEVNIDLIDNELQNPIFVYLGYSSQKKKAFSFVQVKEGKSYFAEIMNITHKFDQNYNILLNPSQNFIGQVYFLKLAVGNNAYRENDFNSLMLSEDLNGIIRGGTSSPNLIRNQDKPILSSENQLNVTNTNNSNTTQNQQNDQGNNTSQNVTQSSQQNSTQDDLQGGGGIIPNLRSGDQDRNIITAGNSPLNLRKQIDPSSANQNFGINPQNLDINKETWAQNNRNINFVSGDQVQENYDHSEIVDQFVNQFRREQIKYSCESDGQYCSSYLENRKKELCIDYMYQDEYTSVYKTLIYSRLDWYSQQTFAVSGWIRMGSMPIQRQSIFRLTGVDSYNNKVYDRVLAAEIQMSVLYFFTYSGNNINLYDVIPLDEYLANSRQWIFVYQGYSKLLQRSFGYVSIPYYRIDFSVQINDVKHYNCDAYSLSIGHRAEEQAFYGEISKVYLEYGDYSYRESNYQLTDSYFNINR